MHIISFSLTNFRNHSARTLSFLGESTVIIGPNGSGKTSILEAIHAFATTKSFKGKDIEAVQLGTNEAHLELQGCIVDGDKTLRISFTKSEKTHVKKQFSKEGVIVPAIKFIGQFYTVLFTTDLINDFTDKGQTRRKFFNQFLCQLDPQYLHILLLYERVLKDRTKLLKMIREGSDPATLHYWNNLLILYGSQITQKRFEIISSLSAYLKEDQKEAYQIRISYNSQFSSFPIEKIVNKMKEALLLLKKNEIASGRTLVGPHKDDFDVFLSEKNIKDFASRGEQKLCIGFLLHAMASYISEKKNTKPIILLDDVKAEMDKINFHRIINLFLQDDFQIIATALDEDIYQNVLMKKIFLN